MRDYNATVSSAGQQAADDGFVSPPGVRRGPVHHSSATASGGLPSKPMRDDSIDRTLTDAGLPLMFLDVRQGRRNEEARSWLSMPRSLLANVSADCLVRPSTALDAFFFVSTLTPAILSSNEAP